MKKTPKENPVLFQQSIFDDIPGEPRKSKVRHLYPGISDTESDKILFGIIALSLVKGIGFHSVCDFFDSGLVYKLWEMSSDEIKEHVAKLPASKRFNVLELIEFKNQTLIEAEKTVAELRRQEVLFIPIGSRKYPESLYRLNEPPRWIFAKGDTDCLQADAIIAVVGTRKASPMGLRLATQCAGELAKRNVVVLSGLARGIDEKAHQGAVENYGQSIAVLGYGLLAPEIPHDSNLAEQILECDGVIVSEYLPFDIPSRNGFLRRNELQAALSNAVIPVECPTLDSGTGATIRRAMKLNTPVVGIVPENESNEPLLATKANLEKLNKPVFKVRSENSKDFWRFLQGISPDHEWSIDPRPRQERFFRDIVKRIAKAKKGLAIDEIAVDRLAQEIKNTLQKG